MSVSSPETNVQPGTTALDFDKDASDHLAEQSGVRTEEPEFVDYFGFITTHKFYLPDGKQYFEFQTLNEGMVSALQTQGASEVIVQRKTGDAKMKVDQAKDRHALIKVSLINWSLWTRSVRDGSFTPVPFNTRELDRVLREFPPAIISDLERAIRKENPTLNGERSVQDIEDDIKQLQDELDEAKKRELGKASS